MRGPRSSSTIHVLTINWESSIVREKHTSRMILRVLKAGLFPTSVGVASSSKPYCHSRNQVPSPLSRQALGYSASPYSETPPRMSCLPVISTAPLFLRNTAVRFASLFMNIKWLDHLELRIDSGPNTAKTIALGRWASVEEAGAEREQARRFWPIVGDFHPSLHRTAKTTQHSSLSDNYVHPNQFGVT